MEGQRIDHYSKFMLIYLVKYLKNEGFIHNLES